ncbi:PRD domain-containing protein [Tuberibacillus sp. Marseille-P3662]|uniref:PRD domain-containing protein n=1 Tax=Tuberibacillus sp. Marseille-P3662 TaxID=1965358 RepID=UPI000A1C95AE|nr:PRD domain-containing protein [Tuberibacillus sp. Marseille-P3662]
MLSEEMEERLDLLLSSEQITSETYKIVKEQLKTLIEMDQLDVNHETAGSFTNHLAIAVERINQGHPLDGVSEQTEELIEANPQIYRFSQNMLKSCLWNYNAYPTRAEEGYITLYLAMFNQQ